MKINSAAYDRSFTGSNNPSGEGNGRVDFWAVSLLTVVLLPSEKLLVVGLIWTNSHTGQGTAEKAGERKQITYCSLDLVSWIESLLQVTLPLISL